MMSTSSRAGPSGGGSGGKVLRQRRRHSPASSSPYCRPDPPAPSTEARNPNWFFALLAPASRLVASSAARLVYSVLGGNDSQPSSSSSASTSSSDEDSDANSAEQDVLPMVPQESSQNRCIAVMHEEFGTTSQPIKQRSEAKITIERLILQETFSRDEYIHLTKILQSRVVDDLAPRENFQKYPYDNPRSGDFAVMGRSCLSESKKKSAKEWESRFGLSPGLAGLTGTTPDLCITAVMEAKKWRQERKLKSIPSLHSEQAPCTPPNLPNDVSGGDIGSPVDIAKSYMQVRPLWASSPSIGYSILHTPLSAGSLLLRDETSIAVACQSAPFYKGQERSSVSKRILGNLCASQSIQQKLAEDTATLSADTMNIIQPLPCDLETNCQLISCDLENTSQPKSVDADKQLTEDANLISNATQLVGEGSASGAYDMQDGSTKVGGLLHGVDGEKHITEKLVVQNYSEETSSIVATPRPEQIVEDSEKMKRPADSHSVSNIPVSEGSMRLQHASDNLHQDCQDSRKEGGISEPVVDMFAEEEIPDNEFKPSVLISAGVDEDATRRGPDVGYTGLANTSNGGSAGGDAVQNHRVGKIPVNQAGGPMHSNHENVKLEGKKPKARKRVNKGTNTPKKTGVAVGGRGRGKKLRLYKDGQG